MILESLRQRLRDLAADRGRTILVVLGVVWGTLSLTVVLSFGSGFNAAMLGAMRSSGRDYLLLWSGATTRPHAGLPAGRGIGLMPEDARLIETSVPGVRDVSAEFIWFGSTLEFQGRRINAGVHGVNVCYGDLRSIRPEPGGRFLNERDGAEKRRVVFLGHNVKDSLFGNSPAIGQTVHIWGLPFTVIGVLRPKVTLSGYEGYDRDKVFMPIETFRAITGWRYANYLVVGLNSPEADAQAIPGIYRLLAAQRGFDPEDHAAVTLHNQVAYDRQTRAILGGTRVLMGIVGCLGLLVSLIGVGNVLYVVVEERRKETGVQMALGAKPAAVLAGFLGEGLLLTLAGGALGLAGSMVILKLFEWVPLGDEARGYLGRPEVSAVTAIVVTLILSAAGCLASLFPARRAAAANPVDSLREE